MESDPKKVRTIVLAEPDAALLDLASEALTWGEVRFRVLRETRGTDAARAIQAFEPDVAVLAVDLPGLDGATIVRTLARARAHRGRIFLGLADKGDAAAARRMIESGCRDVIGRPFTARELRRRVIEALGDLGADERAQVLIVCADEAYAKAFARQVEDRAAMHVFCARTLAEAGEIAAHRPPRAVVLVAPDAAEVRLGRALDLASLLEPVREAGIAAPVLLVADRGDGSERRSLPRRQALEEGPRILHLLLREPEGAGNWKWSSAVHDLGVVASFAAGAAAGCGDGPYRGKLKSW